MYGDYIVNKCSKPMFMDNYPLFIDKMCLPRPFKGLTADVASVDSQ